MHTRLRMAEYKNLPYSSFHPLPMAVGGGSPPASSPASWADATQRGLHSRNQAALNDSLAAAAFFCCWRERRLPSTQRERKRQEKERVRVRLPCAAAELEEEEEEITTTITTTALAPHMLSTS